MSYQKSRTIRTTGLKDLILDRTFAGQGLGKSIVSSIKDKTIASVKGVTEKFDPLNIASALGGSLGGYAFGKLTGRSNEDISYFTGRKVSDASKKNKNPLLTKVADGEKRPTKKGEGLADVLARIFNLLKFHMAEVKKEHEITANFEKEKEDEKELRHKEIIEAISKIGGGTATPVGPVKEGGMFSKLLQMIKNMIEKAFQAIKPILDFVKNIMKALGGKTVQFLKFLAAFGTEASLGILLPAAAAAALMFLVTNEKNKILANPDSPEYRNNPFAQKLRGEVKSEQEAAQRNAAQARRQVPRTEVENLLKTNITDEELKQEYGGTRDDLKKWLDKTKDEKTARWQRPVFDSKGNIVIKGGDTREDLRVKTPKFHIPGEQHVGQQSYTPVENPPEPSPVAEPKLDNLNGSSKDAYLPMDGRERGAFIPGNEPLVVPAPAATLTPRYNPITRQMEMAQRQNLDLNLASATEPETIVIDKSKIINTGDSGGTEIIKSASVRTDNKTLRGIQKQNTRFGPVAMA